MEIHNLKAEKEKRNEEGKELKTVLIFGVSSFVGSNLAELLKKDYKVIGTYNKTKVQIPGVLSIPCDVLAKEEVQMIFFAFKPDFAIYCVGLSSLIQCAMHEDRADALNTSGLFTVTEYAQRYKSKICYISSNYVFAGEDKNYMEMDIPDSNTVYGKTQASAEFYIQKTSLNYVIFRCCKLYGKSLSPIRTTWFEGLQKSILRKKRMNCDDSLQVGFLDVSYLAMIIKMSFEKRVTNRLFQVCSEDVTTYYKFAQEYCKIFDEGADLVSKGKWPFPYSTSGSSSFIENLTYQMDISNLEGYLRVKMPTIKESLEFTLKRLHGGQSKSKKGSQGEGIKFI